MAVQLISQEERPMRLLRLKTSISTVFLSWYKELIRQIDIDFQFLEAENIMDYSLLIGVHICNYRNNGEMNLSPSGKADAQDYC